MDKLNHANPNFGPRARVKARLRNLFAALASRSGVAWIWRMLVARHGVRILAYHGIETPPSSPFSVTVENFEAQMAFLATQFNVVELATIPRWRRGEYQSDKPMVALTFDDGFTNNLQFAAPILQRYRLPATFFIIAGKLDGRDRRFMTADEARDLENMAQFTLGSHTLNHRSVAQIDDAGRELEIGGSKTQLEMILNKPIDCFCYPYGTFNDFDDKSVAALADCGYVLACTSINGINLPGTDLFRLRRTKIEWSDDMKTFKRLAAGAMDGWFFVDYFLRFLQRPRAVKFE